ncbi:unnamed protein product [Rhodiola kirilowii]
MEKDFYPWTQNPVTFPIDMARHDTSNCSLDMNFYNNGFNWDQNDPFESALSSMVSSPAPSAAPAAVCGGLLQLIELIGKLGSVRSPSEIEIPNHSYIANQSGNNSCYSTPMNSPPKLDMDQIRPQLPALSPFTSDPGFAERAARFSCFGSRSFNGRMSQSQRPVNGAEMAYNTAAAAGPVESNRLQRVSSCQLPKSHPSDSKEESSVSQKVHSNERIGRKRKSMPRGKAKEAQSSKVGVERNDSDSKRTKSGENESKEDSKPPEPFKDYIHVIRARRGQATDSHSLAERVRREKISERMKFLQDLVPGCNKVTGKAVMLDEIINYVQLLQQQVEFLSMKLATVNPRMDSVHVEALLSKEILQSRVNMYTVESSNSASAMFPFAYQSQDSQLCNNSLNNDNHLRQSMNGVCNSASQVSMWGDELHSVVQMGFTAGSMEPSEMKMEP